MFDYHIILDFEMNPVFATNSNQNIHIKSEIIEIGAVKLNKELKVVDRFNSYVRPDYNYQITPNITHLTGINSDVAFCSERLGDVLKSFEEWIGKESVCRIYSWSNNDYEQLKNECKYKNIAFPSNMRRWLDFQRVFPRMMNITHRRKQMALKEATKYFDVRMDPKMAHDALYDAEITTEILIPFLNGSYKEQVSCMYQFTHNSEKGSTLGDMCGEVLKELLMQLQLEPV